MSDVSKTNELIAEARGWAEATSGGGSELLSKLADALAARVPVQGEPNDDRERPTIGLARVISAWDQGKVTTRRIPHWAVGLASHLIDGGHARAVVPDAATDELRAGVMTPEEAIEAVLRRPGMYGLVDKQAHRAATAALDRVRALHPQAGGGQPNGDFALICNSCMKYWPCPTIAALDGGSNV